MNKYASTMQVSQEMTADGLMTSVNFDAIKSMMGEAMLDVLQGPRYGPKDERPHYGPPVPTLEFAGMTLRPGDGVAHVYDEDNDWVDQITPADAADLIAFLNAWVLKQAA